MYIMSDKEKLESWLSDDIVERWLLSFASSVPKKILNEHILMSYNHLWHIFTWGRVPCISGDDAREAYDKLLFEKAIMFYGGYSENNYPLISHVEFKHKVFSDELDSLGDVYIVDQQFKWTYVNTHENGWCGPYLCYSGL